jgi:HK97 family phage major capsid protein
MAKTFDELLATGTEDEITAQIVANTKSAAVIYAKKDPSQEETDEATRLDDETEKLTAKGASVKKFNEAKARNATRLEQMNTVDRPPAAGGAPDDTTKSVKVEFPLTASLKNFRKGIGGIETAADAAKHAYRFGKFMEVVLNAPAGNIQPSAALEWCKSNGIEIKVQQEATPQDGGVLVPVEFERTLIDLRELYGVFRRNVKTVPMAAETKFIPRRTGGLTAYFVGEGAAGTQSSKTWDNIQLVARKLMTLVTYSTEVSEDAIINLADDLAGEIAYAFALKEDNCGFLGDGTSTYGNITGVTTALYPTLSATIANVAGIQVQTTISTGTFASAVIGDFTKTIAKLPVYADTPNAKWYMHKTFYSSIPQALMAAAGGNTWRDLSAGPTGTTFLGYPVEFAQVLPFTWVANTIYALFGDLSLAAKMGDRRQTTLFTDPYSLSANDQIQIRGTERFDIKVHDVGNASGTAALRVPGPLVAFASAAS